MKSTTCCVFSCKSSLFGHRKYFKNLSLFALVQPLCFPFSQLYIDAAKTKHIYEYFSPLLLFLWHRTRTTTQPLMTNQRRSRKSQDPLAYKPNCVCKVFELFQKFAAAEAEPISSRPLVSESGPSLSKHLTSASGDS